MIDKKKYSRKTQLKSYGLTTNDYNRMFNEQNGKCAICSTDIPGNTRQNFCVDHNHTTGKIRNLLCHNCNKAIGICKENTDVLRKMGEYLKCNR